MARYWILKGAAQVSDGQRGEEIKTAKVYPRLVGDMTTQGTVMNFVSLIQSHIVHVGMQQGVVSYVAGCGVMDLGIWRLTDGPSGRRGVNHSITQLLSVPAGINLGGV